MNPHVPFLFGICLLARRRLERGVRFVQLYHRGWNHHSDIQKHMPASALLTDQASAALVKDLKQRGLLEDTFVIWGGEFGRTPMDQGAASSTRVFPPSSKASLPTHRRQTRRAHSGDSALMAAGTASL